MKTMVRRMKALGDENRFRIVMMLMERRLCVCELLDVLDIAGGTLSAHLKLLREAGLIDQKKVGRWIEYFIADPVIRDFLLAVERGLEDHSQVLADRKAIAALSRDTCSQRARP